MANDPVRRKKYHVGRGIMTRWGGGNHGGFRRLDKRSAIRHFTPRRNAPLLAMLRIGMNDCRIAPSAYPTYENQTQTRTTVIAPQRFTRFIAAPYAPFR
jgi:hypothetical protein